MALAAHRVARHRVRSFLLYAVISIAIAVIAIAVAFLKTTSVVEDRWGHDALFKWGGLTLFTLVLFVFFIGASEKCLSSRRFWGMTAILLAGHLAIFALVLTRVGEWRVMWFMVIFFEYPLFVFFRERFVSPR
jgi:hypothetical protein